MPGNMDLLLGADNFSCAWFHGRRFGPSGSHSTFKMQFGCVLAGAVHLRHTSLGLTNLCYMWTVSEEHSKVDDMLKQLWEKDHNVKQSALSKDEITAVDDFDRPQHGDEQEGLIFKSSVQGQLTRQETAWRSSTACTMSEELVKQLKRKQKSLIGMSRTANCVLQWIPLCLLASGNTVRKATTSRQT